jgi:hypothetical protein
VVRLRSRLRGLVLLLALVPVELLTVAAALRAEPNCCGTTMCIHHRGGDPVVAKREAGVASATSPAPGAPAAPSGPAAPGAPAAPAATTTSTAPAASGAAHCAHGAAPVERECSMRGCNQQRDELLPLSPPASLPHPTSFALSQDVSALPIAASRSLLDRAAAVEPPPPRSLPA